MSSLFIPSDNDIERENSLTNEGQGTCGPAAVAVIIKKTVKATLNEWPVKYPGWGAWKDIKLILERHGYSVKSRSGKKSPEFPHPESDEAIIRIQWLDDEGKEYYWAEASRHTHFVAMKKLPGDGKHWMVFCNSRGWFPAHGSEARDYLEDEGFVTSYYELSLHPSF